MKKIIPAVFIIAILVAIIIRSLTFNHFKTDANHHANPSYDHSIIITTEQYDLMKGNKLVLLLDGCPIPEDIIESNPDIIKSDASSVLANNNRKRIMGFRGNVFIIASDPVTSSGIWTIFSQMGREKLYILSDSSKPEVLKYEFRPQMR